MKNLQGNFGLIPLKKIENLLKTKQMKLYRLQFHICKTRRHIQATSIC